MDNLNNDLCYLHDMDDYKVAEGYPDVRGWEVLDADKRTVGKVDGLLVNKQAERVVYLDVEVDNSVKDSAPSTGTNTDTGSEVQAFVNEEGEDHLLIPIGLVGIDEDMEEVYCDRINSDTFAAARRYNKGAGIRRSYELVVYRQYFPGAVADNANTADDSDFYDRDEFYFKGQRRKL